MQKTRELLKSEILIMEEKIEEQTERLNEAILNEALLKDKIYVIRGVQVMLDSDLAKIYGYTTKRLNEQVKNNIEKFDEEDLMFQLTKEENDIFLRSNFLTLEKQDVLRSKNSTLEPTSGKGKYSKHNYKAFTERGIKRIR